MATDLETAQTRLAAYQQAETDILLGGQEGMVAGRKWKKADLPAIQQAIRDLKLEIADLTESAQGQCRLHTGVPR